MLKLPHFHDNIMEAADYLNDINKYGIIQHYIQKEIITYPGHIIKRHL